MNARVGKKKQIAQRTGLDLLDEEDLEKSIRALSKTNTRISPETKKARLFLIEQLVARGYKRADIAYMLGVSVKTVYNLLKAVG